MNEKQLSSFLAAADQKSFSKAAEQAYISPPALIQQINLLEESLGFKLFKRSYHGLELTPSGEYFYQAASRILDIYADACQKGQELARADSRRIRFAFISEKLPDFFITAYKAFLAQHPEVEFSFVLTTDVDMLNTIRMGNADICLCSHPNESSLKGLRFIPLQHDTLCFCMRYGHPLADEKELTPELLNRYRVFWPKNDWERQTVDEQLSNRGIRCIQMDKDSSTLQSMQARIFSLITSDDIVVSGSLPCHMLRGALHLVPSDIPSNDFGLIYADNPSPTLECFVQFLHRAMQ